MDETELDETELYETKLDETKLDETVVDETVVDETVVDDGLCLHVFLFNFLLQKEPARVSKKVGPSGQNIF
jgi:hypothetical protein